MKTALLVHGWATKSEYYDLKYPSGSNSHWFPWLSKQLIVKNIHAVALEMPNGYYPQYEIWKKELERFDINQETILIGHSCGAGFLIRWLSENDTKVGRVVLVAPWLGINPGDDFDESFFDFTIDSNIAQKTDGITVFNSSDDYESIQESVNSIREQVKDIKYVEFADKGHFTFKSLGTEEFPELMEEIIPTYYVKSREPIS